MNKQITYKSSGVDIVKAGVFKKAIGARMASHTDASVLRRTGAFACLYDLTTSGKYKHPVLVSSTDGVGTKLLLAQKFNMHDTVGIDLVAMNVNDILCVGAKPLFFLDYIACGKLHPKVMSAVVKGVMEGCRRSGCSLIGGETAEMPGMLAENHYDVAGFVVGVVEKNKLIDGSAIRAGDCLIGFPSSGIHSNGYTLVRKVLSEAEQRKFKKVLLEPTRIYAKEVLSLTEKFNVHGIAHITGGAFYDKLTKILPTGLCFDIDVRSWHVPAIFNKIQEKGNISFHEMYRTFNMGIGLAVVVAAKDIAAVKKFLKSRRIQFEVIGSVIRDGKRKLAI